MFLQFILAVISIILFKTPPCDVLVCFTQSEDSIRISRPHKANWKEKKAYQDRLDIFDSPFVFNKNCELIKQDKNCVILV